MPLPNEQQQQQLSSDVPQVAKAGLRQELLPDEGSGGQDVARQRPWSPRRDESTQTSRRWKDSEATVAGGHGMHPSGADEQVGAEAGLQQVVAIISSPVGHLTASRCHGHIRVMHRVVGTNKELPRSLGGVLLRSKSRSKQGFRTVTSRTLPCFPLQRHQPQDRLPLQHHTSSTDKEHVSQRSVPDSEQQKQTAPDNQAGQDRQDGQLIKAYHHREDSHAGGSVRAEGPEAAAGDAQPQPSKQQQVTVVEVEDAPSPSTGGGRARGSAEPDAGTSDGEETDEEVEEDGGDGEGGEQEDSGSDGSIYDVDTTVLGMHVLGLQQQLAALTHQNSVITSQVGLSRMCFAPRRPAPVPRAECMVWR